MGIFDLPAPLLGWIDEWISGWLPPILCLIFWAMIGAGLSMLLYKALSAQHRIALEKRKIFSARQQLNTFDGEFGEAWPLIRRLLRLSFVQVGRVGWPAIVASLPLLALLGFLSNTYGYSFPPPETVPEIRIQPPDFTAQWIDGTPTDQPRIIVGNNETDDVIADIRISAPVPVVHKFRWYNVFMGNPLGYLPDEEVIKRVEIALPAKTYLPYGPEWLKGWEVSFLFSLVVFSLIIKIAFRIE